jgi:hypothetical protein
MGGLQKLWGRTRLDWFRNNMLGNNEENENKSRNEESLHTDLEFEIFL